MDYLELKMSRGHDVFVFLERIWGAGEKKDDENKPALIELMGEDGCLPVKNSYESIRDSIFACSIAYKFIEIPVFRFNDKKKSRCVASQILRRESIYLFHSDLDTQEDIQQAMARRAQNPLTALSAIMGGENLSNLEFLQENMITEPHLTIRVIGQEKGTTAIRSPLTYDEMRHIMLASQLN